MQSLQSKMKITTGGPSPQSASMFRRGMRLIMAPSPNQATTKVFASFISAHLLCLYVFSKFSQRSSPTTFLQIFNMKKAKRKKSLPPIFPIWYSKILPNQAGKLNHLKTTRLSGLVRYILKVKKSAMAISMAALLD